MVPGPARSQAVGFRSDVVRIGVLEGNPSEVFGRIAGVAVDGAGNIFVLDDLVFRVSWFTYSGSLVGEVGGTGGGPGEFRWPAGIDLDEHGRIHVLDYAQKRITVFQPRDEGLVLEREVPLPVLGTAFCILRDLYYVLVPEGDSLIHVVDAAGHTRREFGESLAEVPVELARHGAVVRSLMNRGFLYCLEDPARIVFLPEALPIVRAFSVDGQEVWRTTLRDYHGRSWEVTRGGRGLRMSPDSRDGSVHTGVAAAWAGPDSLLLTLRLSSLTNPVGELEARILSVRTGEEIGVLTPDWVVATKEGGVFYGYVNHPFPQVIVSKDPPWEVEDAFHRVSRESAELRDSDAAQR